MSDSTIDKQVDRLVEVFRQAEEEIQKEIQRALLHGLTEDSYAIKMLQKSRRQVQAILGQLETAASTWVSEAVPSVYITGIREARGDLLSAGHRISKSLGAIHTGAAQILADATFSRLSDVITTAGRKTDDIYRTMQLGASIRGGALGYESWQQTRKRLLKNLVDSGITGFVDKLGKQWNIKSYTEMLARASLMNVHNEAKGREFMEHGEDLVLVSSHSGKCEKCAPWENRVLSLSGHTKGYPTMEDAKSAGLFHPRCRHGFELYLQDEEEDPEETRRKEEDRRAVWEEKAKEAAEAAAARAAQEKENRRWTINPKKQARHMAGTEEYAAYAEKLAKTGLKPSILTLPQHELQRILNNREGEWEKAPGTGLSNEKWKVRLNRPVGLWYDKNGNGPVESNLLIVIPADTGSHVYPGNPH